MCKTLYECSDAMKMPGRIPAWRAKDMTNYDHLDWRIKVSVPFRVPLYRQLSRNYIFENENFTWKALKCDKKCAVSKQNNFVYS